MLLFENQRISKLEETLEKFIESTNNSILHLNKKMEEFKDEMKEFKDEMKEFKDEMKEFKDEMKEFKDEMKEFKDEMKEFKDEMKEFKDDSLKWRLKIDEILEESRRKEQENKIKEEEYRIKSEQEKREWNKKWGEIANKFGTFAEDIVFPNMETIARQYFNIDIEDCDYQAERVKRKHIITKNQKEFDYIVVKDNKVILNETKSTPRQNYVEEFVNFINSNDFINYFPEYKDYKLIPIFASFYVPENIVSYLTKNKIYVMGMKNDTMDLINFNEVNNL